MCRQTVTPLNGIAFTMLILSALACAISFCAPFWLFYPNMFNAPLLPRPYLIRNLSKSYPFAQATYRGLWAVCFKDNSCVWFWQNNFEAEKTLPGKDTTISICEYYIVCRFIDDNIVVVTIVLGCLNVCVIQYSSRFDYPD